MDAGTSDVCGGATMRSRLHRRKIAAIRTSPPIIPPTIAPTSTLLCRWLFVGNVVGVVIGGVVLLEKT